MLAQDSRARSCLSSHSSLTVSIEIQVNRVIERSFHLDSEAERDEWMTAYKTCKAKITDRTVSQVSHTYTFSRASMRMQS
jgi:hypothetical protein